MSLWYWRDGTKAVDARIGSPEWEHQMHLVEEKLRDPKYKRVAETTLPNGLWVSTVWLGLDYGYPISDEDQTNWKPMIFETMVFDTNNKRKYKLGKTERTSLGEDIDMKRYSTEEEALKGHEEMVKKYS